MKKFIALLMTLALVISALALPALAEEAGTTTDAATSATTTTAKGGRGGMPGNGQQPPAMNGNGQNNQNSQQPPAMNGNDQNNQNGRQPPAMNGNSQSNQNSQQPPSMPGDNQNGQNDQQTPSVSGNGRNGQKPSGKPGKGRNSRNGQNNQNGQQPPAMNGSEQNCQPGMRLDFEQLVRDGVIDQELCEKILNYMKEHAPQDQSGGTSPAEDSESPAAPDSVQGQQGGFEEQLLKGLLDNSVITQEQYDLLLARITATDTAATVAAETTESGT